MSETLAISHGLPPSIREGEVLGGKYRLEQEIGRGAMGTVWSAVHLSLGQRVAIKLIAAEHAQSPEARMRFSIEAKAAARLRSRYVVQVYDDGETAAGTPYIVLEYLAGETLERRLEREHDLPLNDAVRITRHVARALSRAHVQGIVHRDLKPGNVFLARSEDDEMGWIAKVLDFGIAKIEGSTGVLSSQTKTGTLLGTPLFMSPEQARGVSTVDARSDLYSLGMVFYNMLTGSYAFYGESFADVLVAICTAPLPDLRAAAPWVPESVAHWFQRACAREARDRFQTADELVEALDLALGVSTGAFAKKEPTAPQLDTLRGHSPPVAHGVARGAPGGLGQSGKGQTQVLVTDPTLLGSSQGSHHAVASRTLDSLSLPVASRAPLVIATVVVLFLFLGGSAWWFARRQTGSTRVTSAPSVAVTLTPSAVVTVTPRVDPSPAWSAPESAPESAPTQKEAVNAPVSGAGSAAASARPHPVPAQPHPVVTPQSTGKTPPATNARAGAPARNTATDIGF